MVSLHFRFVEKSVFLLGVTLSIYRLSPFLVEEGLVLCVTSPFLIYRLNFGF